MNEIRIGQKWQEVDHRFTRILEVVGFCDKTGKVILKTDGIGGRKTKAMRERFNGKRGCYKLISDTIQP
jgi:hypothetical protein